MMLLTVTPVCSHLLLWVTLVWIPGYTARELDWRTKLTRDLFTNYERDVLPLCRDQESIVTAHIDVSLRGILDVEEPRQVVTTTTWQRWKWIDCRLRWNVTNYAGIDKLIVSADRIWIPDVVVFDSAEDFDGAQKTLVILSPNGEAFLLAPAIVKLACKIDIRYFPFDRQTCRLMYVSSAYTGVELNLMNTTDHGDTSLFIENGEWELIGMPVYRNLKNYPCCKEPFPDITYYIVIQRQPLYYIFNLVMPCLLITGISLLLFYLPPDSGEKISMGITVLLSLCVFLLMVSERMPASSETVPLIGQYFGATIILVSVSCAMTVVVLHIHHSGVHGREVPPWLRKLTLDWLARFLCMDPELYENGSLEEKAKNGQSRHPAKLPHLNNLDHTSDYLLERVTLSNNSSDCHSGDCSAVLGQNTQQQQMAALEALMEKQLSSLNSIERMLRERHTEADVCSDWRKVAMVVDRVLLVFMCVVVTAVCMGIFLSKPTYAGMSAEDSVMDFLN